MRIHQIIPAQPGWHLKEENGELTPIICWALVTDPDSPIESPGDSVVLPVLEDDRSLGTPHVPVGSEVLRSPDESYEYSLWAADSWHEGLKEGWILHSISAAESDTGADITVAMKKPIGRS